MEYRDFMEQIKKDLPERLSGTLKGAVVNTTQVDKLQGRSYEGLSIVPEGSMIGLTMDLQPYFQMFNDGMAYENIVEQIVDRASGSYAARPAVTAEDIGSYEAVKDKLMIQLIGREGNEGMLRTIPHHSIEDMEIVYRLRVQDTEMGLASALVTNSMLERYGITAEQLKQDAFVSAVSHAPFEIKTMAEILNELMGANYSRRCDAYVCGQQYRTDSRRWSDCVSGIYGGSIKTARWGFLCFAVLDSRSNSDSGYT